MENKSVKYEYRILHCSTWHSPFFIERRRIGIMKLLGWSKLYRDEEPDYVLTFNYLDMAKEWVKSSIQCENMESINPTIKVVWPYDNNLINHY